MPTIRRASTQWDAIMWSSLARSVAAEGRTSCGGAIRAEKVYAILFLGLSFFKAPEVTSIGRHKIGQIIQFNSRS